MLNNIFYIVYANFNKILYKFPVLGRKPSILLVYFAFFGGGEIFERGMGPYFSPKNHEMRALHLWGISD